ncbi:MAG: FtsB family cell division protein [Adlercreutzia equolifaciens]
MRAHAGRFADDPDFEVRVSGRAASAGRSSARSFAAPASGSRYAPLSMSDAHRGPGSLESRGAARAADVDDEELEAPLGPLGRLTSRFGKKRRQRAKERAGRAYYRQYEAGKPSDASQAGPRAAVYKGEMGSSHRRSSRMQQKESGASGRVKMPEAKAPFFTRAPFIVTCATVLCLGLGRLSSTGRPQLYQDIRERDRLAAEYEAVTERNAAIEASVDALSTEAGIEDAARTQLGWVHEGEHAVSVSGLDEKDEASEFRGNIVSEDITAPDTWYSDLLDPLFGVE